MKGNHRKKEQRAHRLVHSDSNNLIYNKNTELRLKDKAAVGFQVISKSGYKKKIANQGQHDDVLTWARILFHFLTYTR